MIAVANKSRIYNLKFRGQRESISRKALTNLNDKMAASYKFSTPERKRQIVAIFVELNLAYLRQPPLSFKDPMDAEDWFGEFQAMIPRALEKYEPSLGHVVAYIIGWKKASINAWLKTKGAIRLPENQRLRFFQIDRAIRKSGREKVSESDIRFYDEANFKMVSMSGKAEDGDGELIETIIGDDPRSTAGCNSDGDLWAQVKAILTEEEYQLWAWKFHPTFELTSRDIGIRIGLTEERVRQKLDKIRDRLKKRISPILRSEKG